MRGLAITISSPQDTSWQSRLKAAQLMGFDDFVVWATAPDVPVASIIEAAANRGIKVRALRLSEDGHAKPTPSDQPGFANLACPDGSTRQRSVALITTMLASFQRNSVRTLILDAGLVSWPGSRQLVVALRAAADDGPEALAPLLATIAKERGGRVDAHLEALVRSLFEIERAADGLGIALTTPDSPLGVCLPDQMELALTERPASRRHYWHLTCAARTLERLGVVNEDAWLERFGGRMNGVMLSDSIGGEGGQVPGLGEVDFKRIKPYLNPETAKVMTVGDDKSGFKLQFGKDHLSQVGIF